MNSQQLKKIGLPDKPGVYFFKRGKNTLYIGKATSLRSRVRSYFSQDLIATRGPLILDMVTLATNVEYQETDSVLESLILEANLIKKYKPKYNTKEKDNKSFNYVCITKDALPRVLIIRGRNLGNLTKGNFFSGPRTREDEGPDHSKKFSFSKIYGPFPNGLQLREAMKIIRRIFPFIDNDSVKKNNVEFYKQLGLVPQINSTSQKVYFQKVHGRGDREPGPDHFKKKLSAPLHEYKNNIKNLKLFFEGKKKSVVINLKKEMLLYASRREFEKAGIIKKRIFALNHINDVALLKDEITQGNSFEKVLGRGGRESGPDRFQKNFPAPFIRIEAYDIAHMGGKNMVGVMTVIEGNEVNKNEYRKFIIRTQNDANDTGALDEVLSRRFRHLEWGLPNLVVVDGSTAQVNVAKRVLNRYQFNIPIVGVIKDDKHKAKVIMGDEDLIKKYKKLILLANSESHRFVITFHKLKRNKSFLSK